MARRDIVVIGASAGGLSALRELVGSLPRDFPASIFVVMHVPAHSPSRLPELLTAAGALEAVHAVDGEKIERGRIYVAPPDRHMLLERHRVMVKNGPMENRFRPSIDSLFRSAAYVFGPRVIGVVLSGALNDGTSGLWTVKRHGGAAIVQDPKEAQFESMPMSALEHVHVDHSAPVAEMGALLVSLISKPALKRPKVSAEERKLLELEITIATRDNAFEMGIMEMGEFVPFTCPDCQGALIRLKESDMDRFRCHTGHAFTANTLLAGISEVNEDKLWQAMRGFEEAAMLLDQIAQHFRKRKQTKTVQLFARKAHEVRNRARVIHDSVLETEQLSEDIQHERPERPPERKRRASRS
jgi:two-component system chemotaxis response regulator CheB